MQNPRDCPLWRPIQRAGIAGWQDDNPAGTEGDGNAQRRVCGDCAIHQVLPADRDRWKDPWHGGAGQDRFDRRTRGQAHPHALLIGRHDVQRQPGILDPVEGKMDFQKSAKWARIGDAVRPAQNSE